MDTVSRVSRRLVLQGFGVTAFAQAKSRIASVRATPVALSGPTASQPPVFSSEDDVARRRWRGPFAQLTGAIVVEIKTTDGLTGYGVGGGGRAAAAVVEDHFGPLLAGSDPARIELLWDRMFTASQFYGRKGIAILALSGVDLALWDLAGKRAGKPVHALLGGEVRRKVPAYYTGYQVEQARAMGFRKFKIPIRDGVAEGAAGVDRTEKLLMRTRDQIGSDAELMIDCNSLWDVPYTLEMDRRLSSLHIAFFEEPLIPDDLDGYRRLCSDIRHTRIASGEHEYTRYGFQELIRNRAVQVLQPDICWSGGLTELRRIALLAAAESLPLLPHRGASAFSLPFIAATPNCSVAESFGTLESGSPLMQAMTSRFEQGCYLVSDAPGFGVGFSDKLIRVWAAKSTLRSSSRRSCIPGAASV